MGSDADLVERARAGDSAAADALVRRHGDLARRQTIGFYAPGHDRDDLVQEALVGLTLAIRNYEPEKGPFSEFVKLCARRQVITAVIAARRVKHRALSDSTRWVEGEDGDRLDVIDVIEDIRADTVDLIADRDEIRRLGRALRVDLTAVETLAAVGVGNGLTYEALNEVAGMTFKTIDNALQRARVKLTPGSAGSARPQDLRGTGHRPVPVVHECPGCGRETVRRLPSGRLRSGPGRPPRCNVCRATDTLAA